MALDYKKLYDEFSEILNSKESEDYFDQLGERQIHKEARLFRIAEFLSRYELNEFMGRLINEHDEAYRSKCYDQGFEPRPNQKLRLLLDFVFKYHRIEEDQYPDFLDTDWPMKTAHYKGYYFTVTYGQGSVTEIYDFEGNCLIYL